MIENLQRKDLSAFEEGEGYRTLIDKYEYTHEQVAQAVGRSRVTVTETLRLLRMPEEIRTLCRHADIEAKGILLEIVKARSVEAMAELVREIVEERLDRSALRQRRQEMESEAPQSETAERGGVPRRPYFVRFRNSDRTFSVSLAFRTETQPEPRQVIDALREMIRELESELEDGKS